MSHNDNNPDSSAPRSSSKRRSESSSTTRRTETSETTSSARFPGMPQRRGFDDNTSLDGSPRGPRFIDHVSDVSGTQDFSNGKFGTLKNMAQESGAADNFLKQITNDGKEALGLSKLDRAKNYAGYTKNGYNSYREKGFKQYTGDVVKHTSKETVKETSRYAVIGGLAGAAAGGISGFAAGGVGALPGALSGAKLGATQGAKFGAKKGVQQGALSSATGAADSQLNQDRENKEGKRAEKAEKKAGKKGKGSVPAAAAAGNSLEGGNKSFDLDNRADFNSGRHKNSRGEDNIHKHSLAATNIPRRETPSERARRMKDRAGESVQGSFANMKNLKGKGSGVVNTKTVAATGAAGAALGLSLMMFMTMLSSFTSGSSAGSASGASYADPCSPSMAVNAVNKVNDFMDFVTGRDEDKDKDEGDTDGGDSEAIGESSAEMDTASDIGTIDNDSQMTVNSGVWRGGKAHVVQASLKDDVKKILANPNEYGLSAERGPHNNETREDRINNVVKIIGVAKGYASNDDDAKKLAMYGVIVSSAETGWENPQGGDRDSVGPFQQRTSIYGKDGVNDVVKSAEMFYKGKSGIPGMMSESSWKTASSPGDIAQAAQNIQRSAFPDGSNYRDKYDVSKKILDVLFENSTKEGSGTGNETDGKGGLPDLTVSDKCGNSATLDIFGNSGNGGSGGWTNPAVGPLTSGFGKRALAAADAENGGHLGQDIGAACGAPIWSASDGKVKDVSKDNSGGNIILIHNDESNVDFMYVHMQEGANKVKIGDNVKAGQEISKVGETGQASGCHLHFQISDPPTAKWFDQSKAVDPSPWMQKNGIKLGLDPHSKIVGGKKGGGTKNVKNDNPDCKTDSKSLQKGLDQACQYLDRPYSWGGGTVDGPSNGINDPAAGIDATNKNGFDCSSYVRYIIYQATDKKVEIPRTAQAQYEDSSSKEISKDSMKPGDLMFYGTPSNLHHVAMYIGDGKMIEAANPTDGLRIREADTGGDFYAATRPHDFG